MTGLKSRVSAAGTASLSLIGDVQAAGLSEIELQNRIAARLRQDLVKNPTVSVFVTERTSQQVSVTGAVGRPGLLPLTRDRRSVADMISEAGGLSEGAGGQVLFYPARGSGGCGEVSQVRVASLAPPEDVEPIEIDLNQEYQPAQENPLALPAVGGDAIVVNRGQIFVDGWVNVPGAIAITPSVTALGALTAAGGAMYPADLSAVVLVRNRRGSTTKDRIAIDMNAVQKGTEKDVSLQAGDIIQVPPSPIRMIPYGLYWLITNVVRVGAGVSLTGM
jgi:polysaccharide export outer membrane protein